MNLHGRLQLITQLDEFQFTSSSLLLLLFFHYRHLDLLLAEWILNPSKLFKFANLIRIDIHLGVERLLFDLKNSFGLSLEWDWRGRSPIIAKNSAFCIFNHLLQGIIGLFSWCIRNSIFYYLWVFLACDSRIDRLFLTVLSLSNLAMRHLLLQFF